MRRVRVTVVETTRHTVTFDVPWNYSDACIRQDAEALMCEHGGEFVACDEREATDVATVWEGPRDSDGEPCNFTNHYRCESCDADWRDQWSCACDDDCPTCGKSITPHHSDVAPL